MELPMSDNTNDKELSMDELKDVSGGGMSLDRLGTNNVKGDAPSVSGTNNGDIHAPTSLSAVSKGRYQGGNYGGSLSVSVNREPDSNDNFTS